MNVGTKSILYGVHAFWFHPLTVLAAWIELYGIPNWKELVCILIHDLGYWGCQNMDGTEGEMHPIWAAEFARQYLDGFGKIHGTYSNLCLFHSRSCAKHLNGEPSKLCWADKLSIRYDPWWFYLLRARLSGELTEYMKDAMSHGLIPKSFTRREWFAWARERGMRVGYTQNPKTAYELEQIP